MDSENREKQSLEITPASPSNPIQISFSLPSNCRFGITARKILQVHFDHPDWTRLQIAKAVGCSGPRVSQVLMHPKVVEAMPGIAVQRKRSLVPKAIKATEELVDQTNNLQVREKVASKLLTESGVYDAPTVKVDAKITFSDVRELHDFVKKVAENAPPIIDVEVISEENGPVQ